MKKYILLIAIFAIIIFSINLKDKVNFYDISINDDTLYISDLNIIEHNNIYYISNDFSVRTIDKVADVYIDIAINDISIFKSYSQFNDLNQDNIKVIEIDNIIKVKCKKNKNSKISIKLKYKKDNLLYENVIDSYLNDYLDIAVDAII